MGGSPHAVHMGGDWAVMNSADDRPGYSGFQTKDAVTVAEILRRAGYPFTGGTVESVTITRRQACSDGRLRGF